MEPKEGIFFKGQIFDAYVFVADQIRKVQTRIVIIDNYIDETVLVQLAKRRPCVSVDIYTASSPAATLLHSPTRSFGWVLAGFIISFLITLFSGFSKFITNFASADRTAEARSRAMRVGLLTIALALCLGKDLLENVYSTLFLGALELRNFLWLVKNAANSRCLSGYEYSARCDTRVSHMGV